MEHSGPIVVGYDGSPSADHAVSEAARLLSPRRALVVVVFKEGVGFELLEAPTITGVPPAPIDVRTALEVDRSLAERAQRLAEQGAELARQAGLEAESLAVADEPNVTIAETLVDVARIRDATALVVGAHGHSRLGEAILGSTSRDVIRNAPCAVLVARAEGD
ncbi:MAG: universal stress protein [Thermoleophilaceae bacterium]